MLVERKMWGFMVIGLLLVMVPETMQLRANHPLHRVVEKINEKYKGDFLGLVLSTAGDAKALLDSGDFVLDQSLSPVNYAGRQFNIGTYKGVASIYVVAPSPLAHVSATVQILVDLFNIVGIIDFGGAGSVSDKLAIGDVAVLSAAAFTGYGMWQNWKNPLENADLPSLNFGDFNYPTPGENKLGSIQHHKVKQYSPVESNNQTFWLSVDEEWLQVASHLKDIPLEKCVNESICVSKEPKVVHGLKGSSSDLLMANEAYGKFLSEKIDISTVDRKSAATISTANANGVPLVVFRAATNSPGVPYDPKLATLGTQNSLKVVSAFVESILVDDDDHYIKIRYH